MSGGSGDDKLFGDGSESSNPDSYTYPQYHGNDVLEGGDGNDEIYGDGGADELYGGGGNDMLVGDANGIPVEYHGEDYLDGGEGDDTLYGYGKGDTLFGGAGDDILEGDSNSVAYADHGDDYLDGEDGNDKLQGDGGSDTLFGGVGNDRLFGDADDVPIANQGDDYLDGEDGNDYLRGFGGNDQLMGGAGMDQLLGEAGNDYLDGGDDSDVLEGGGGDDQLFGGASNDLMRGDAGNDILQGDGGDDELQGGEGNDTLDGGEGADYLFGGAGDDVYRNVDADDSIVDEAGLNAIEFAQGVTDRDININSVDTDGVRTLVMDIGGHAFIQIGSQSDGIRNYGFADGTRLTHEELLGQRFFGAQYISATYADDVLYGYAGDDSLEGEYGNDSLFGYLGDDQLKGGAGNDILSGGQGNDVLSGGQGNDIYLFGRGDGRDVIIDGGENAGQNVIRFAPDIAPSQVTMSRLASGDLLLKLDNGTDQITVQGWYNDPANRFGSIEFGDGTVITGTDLDSLTVAPIEGTALEDALVGTAYSDTILGHGGNDILDGGAGSDRIEGGDGVDSYILSHGMGEDTIFDASAEGNVIQLGGGLGIADLDANRNGNDLVVHIAGTSEGMVLKDYYVNPQSWTVQADGDEQQEQQDVEQVITATEARQQDRIGQMWRDYLGQSRSAAIANALSRGYQLTPDGALYKPWSATGNGTTVFADVTELTKTVTTTTDNDDGTTTSTTTVEQNDSWVTADPRLTDSVIWLDSDTRFEVNANVWADEGYYERTQSTEQVILETDWKPRSAVTETHGSSISPIYGGPYSSDIVGWVTTETARISWSPVGSVTNVLAAGSVDVSTGYFPRYISAGLTTNVETFWYQEIYANDIDNVIYGYRGNPRLGDYGGTLVDAGAGNDTVIGAGFAFGGAGDDHLSNGDVLVGGDGNDTLRGGLVLFGGEGDDYMNGDPDYANTNRTTGTRYLIEPSQFGNDTIEDGGPGFNEVHEALLDTVEFGAGLTADDVTVRWSVEEDDHRDAILTWGTGKQIKMEVAPSGIEAGRGIELVKFDDGTVWNVAELERRAYVPTEARDVLYGGTGDDVLAGLGGDDSLYGEGGNDLVFGGAGDDIIEDSRGNNVLDGGDGNDYIYADSYASFIAGGNGNDEIDSWGEGNVVAYNSGDGNDDLYVNEALTLSLGVGISPASLSLANDGTTFILNVAGSDSIRLIFDSDYRPDVILQIIGAANRTYDFSAVIASFEEAIAQGTSASWSIQNALDANSISASKDHVIGGELAYRYARDGNLNALVPASMQSTPSDPDFGVAAQLVAIDDSGEPINTAPVVNVALEDRVLSEDASFTFQLPGDTFTDPDVGDHLTMSAALGDGSALPAWIHFDADTGTFSGTPDNAAVGNIVVKVTAVDQAGAAVDASFDLLVNNVNDAPVVAQGIETALATQDQVFSFTVPSGTFLDVDAGDALDYTATLTNGDALPDWLTFDTATGTFSGTPGNGNVGPLSVMVTATDSSGVTASSSFELDVANVNDAPTLIYPIADQAAVEDVPFTYTLPADAFKDIDAGDSLTYTVTLDNGTPLPSWLTYDPVTRALSGTPGPEHVGALSVRVTATDAGGLGVSDTFELTVGMAAGQALIGTSGADVLVGTAGHDYLDGMGGSDTLFGNRGNDSITDSDGSDTIDGGDGDDVISDGGSGTNMLRGGNGNDVITFSAVANNTSEGGAGNDLLKVNALNGSSLLYANTFAGGTGNDRMESGSSTDTYLFNRGDGQDVISDDDRLYYQKLDKLVFGEGIATTDVTVTRSGNDLMLKINDPANPGASDEIKIENWDTIWYRIEQVEFADGTTWSAAQLSEWAMAATDEADTLALWSDGGVVDGKGGNDTINFSSFNTSIAPTTIYGGDGNDSINTDSSGNNSSTLTVDGGAGDDTIIDVGRTSIRTLLGGDGNDVITFSCLGYSGNYAINGGAGNDWIKADGYSTGTYRWVNTLTGGGW